MKMKWLTSGVGVVEVGRAALRSHGWIGERERICDDEWSAAAVDDDCDGKIYEKHHEVGRTTPSSSWKSNWSSLKQRGWCEW